MMPSWLYVLVVTLSLACYGSTSDPTNWSILSALQLDAAKQAHGSSVSSTRMHSGPRVLLVGRSIRTQLPGKAFLGQVRCDLSANVYVRTYDGHVVNSAESLQVPIKKIDRNGQLADWFAITDANPNLVSGDIFVAPNGDVSQVAWRPGSQSIFIARYSKGGVFERLIPLDISLQPYQLAIYDTGEILLSGLEMFPGTRGASHAPITVLFDSKGHLLRKLILPGDDDVYSKAARHDSDFVDLNYPAQGNLAVEYGDVALGSDNNAYLIRRTLPTLLYKISRSGHVQRFKVEPGNAGFFPVAIRAANNRLAILFSKNGKQNRIIRVLNLTGQTVENYSSPRDLGEGFSCYAAPDFLFLDSVKGVIYIKWATR